MNTGKKLGIFVFILLLLGFSQSMRAQDFTPQTGAWVINEEANGEPGRGFQIEVQNDILVLYFYGYEAAGDSAFWLATGAFQPGSNEITADLGEYQGGMGVWRPDAECDPSPFARSGNDQIYRADQRRDMPAGRGMQGNQCIQFWL